MNFKSDRIKQEYDSLTALNPKLHDILSLLFTYCLYEFNKKITLTSIFRTQAEHDALYANTPPESRPKSSPHMFWKAVDIRSTDFNDKEKQKMLAFLNCFTYTSGQGRPVAMCHTVAGNVEHFHIQSD